MVDRVVVVPRSGSLNYDVEAASNETALFCKDDSLAVQADAHDADINNIMKRFGMGAALPQNLHTPLQGDFTGVTDFQSAMNMLVDAQHAFMKMPADVRSRFSNDPQLFLEFCSDDKNRDEAIKLGLVMPPAVVPEPPPMKVEVVGGLPGASKP